ncbi:MAG: hypothetical protein HY820_17135 [Acidobacteria bacterium]|nr:hypothetical protein [Acidobacteriota bacterium]
MRVNSLFLTLIGVACSTVPAGAQTRDIDMPADRGLQLSPSLQMKLAERMAQLRVRGADTMGPFVDRVARDWTIEASDCSLVKSQVKLTGVKKNTAWSSANDDGSFKLDLRREASGTAVDAGGNKYMWIFNENLDLDISDSNPSETTKITGGYALTTFQLIALTPAGSGYTAAGYLRVETPTTFAAPPPAPVAATAPPRCSPI